MYRRTVMLSVAILAAISMVMPGVAPARAADETSVVCQANAWVYLYADEAHTTLVDAFSVMNAPTRHRVGSGDFVIQGDRAGPGVDVVGVITGTPYVFEFRAVGYSTVPDPGVTSRLVYMGDWRVTARGAGIVSETRNQQVEIVRDSEKVVDKVWGRHHGLWLSGLIVIYCPQF